MDLNRRVDIKMSPDLQEFIISFCGHLPRYHLRMTSIVSEIAVDLVNRELSDWITGLKSEGVTIKIISSKDKHWKLPFTVLDSALSFIFGE